MLRKHAHSLCRQAATSGAPQSLFGARVSPMMNIKRRLCSGHARGSSAAGESAASVSSAWGRVALFGAAFGAGIVLAGSAVVYFVGKRFVPHEINVDELVQGVYRRMDETLLSRPLWRVPLPGRPSNELGESDQIQQAKLIDRSEIVGEVRDALESSCGTLVVLIGPPASGKTTIALQAAELFDRPVIHFDIGTYGGGEVASAEELARAVESAFGIGSDAVLSAVARALGSSWKSLGAGLSSGDTVQPPRARILSALANLRVVLERNKAAGQKPPVIVLDDLTQIQLDDTSAEEQRVIHDIVRALDRLSREQQLCRVLFVSSDGTAAANVASAAAVLPRAIAVGDLESGRARMVVLGEYASDEAMSISSATLAVGGRIGHLRALSDAGRARSDAYARAALATQAVGSSPIAPPSIKKSGSAQTTSAGEVALLEDPEGELDRTDGADSSVSTDGSRMDSASEEPRTHTDGDDGQLTTPSLQESLRPCAGALDSAARRLRVLEAHRIDRIAARSDLASFRYALALVAHAASSEQMLRLSDVENAVGKHLVAELIRERVLYADLPGGDGQTVQTVTAASPLALGAIYWWLTLHEPQPDETMGTASSHIV